MQVAAETQEQQKKPALPEDKGFRRRMIALAVLAGVLLLIFVLRLAQFQLG